MSNGVPVDEEVARDRVHAAAAAQIRLERVEEVLVTRLRGERTKEAFGERADVVRRLIEDEAERAELVEVDRPPGAVQTATERERVFGLEEREMRAGRSGLRPRDPGGDVIRERGADELPKLLRVRAWIALGGVLAHH